MPAIPVHHTAVDKKSSWDGPAEVAKAPAEEKTLRYMHAWVSADGDPNVKSSFKDPHHDAGTDTPANINGVNNALARLSNTDIPDSDVAGVKAHLNAHRKDAGLKDLTEDEMKDLLAQIYADDQTEVVEQATSRHSSVSPIRVFQGNAKPHEAFWRVRDEAQIGGDPEMELYGVISEYSWFDDGVTPKMFKDSLFNLGKGGPVTLRINSPGGDVIAASMMRSIIATYPGKVTARIDGLCASAATVVALSAQSIKMQDSSYMMIHDPGVGIMGYLNIDILSELLDELKTCKDGIMDVYQSKTGLSRDRLGKMMKDETWMSAQDAVTLGFADEVLGIKTAQQKQGVAMDRAYQTALVNIVQNANHVPLGLILAAQTPATRDGSPEAVERERAAQRLRDYLKLL